MEVTRPRSNSPVNCSGVRSTNRRGAGGSATLEAASVLGTALVGAAAVGIGDCPTRRIGRNHPHATMSKPRTSVPIPKSNHPLCQTDSDFEDCTVAKAATRVPPTAINAPPRAVASRRCFPTPATLSGVGLSSHSSPVHPFGLHATGSLPNVTLTHRDRPSGGLPVAGGCGGGACVGGSVCARGQHVALGARAGGVRGPGAGPAPRP